VNEGLQPGESLIRAVKNGYKTVLSNGYYIDLMQPAWQHYLVDPMPDADLTEMQKKSILGGEATMWSELVTPLTVDSRIWPRTAAIAERFWSSAEIRDIDWMYERLNEISQNLEGFGIRHLQAREYILRNIANYQDTDALEKLAGISEPFKIYTRNAGGTQYKSFSPFTLFADACTADARDVRPFNSLVEGYIQNGEPDYANGITSYLNQWEQIKPALEKIADRAPLVQRILPFASRLHELSGLLLSWMEKGYLNETELNRVESLLNQSEDPSMNLDVELAVAEDMKALANFLRKKNK
jgi:hexosaminidase